MDIKSSKPPHVFISYAWGTPEHNSAVKAVADRLLQDGVEVVFDGYDLRPGDDRYAYMERAVTDPNITHVLCLCDSNYKRKAEARGPDGVGTESQILSKDIYGKVENSRVIPILFEDKDRGDAKPAFFNARIDIDFSTPEKQDQNWESLIRLLYDQPAFERPALGKKPAYLDTNIPPQLAAFQSKYQTYRSAYISQRPNLTSYRRDVIESGISFADSLRIRTPPVEDRLAQKIVDDVASLGAVRDVIASSILLEAPEATPETYGDVVVDILEQVLSVGGPPNKLMQYRECWFDAQEIFITEVFHYVVAALLRSHAYVVLNKVFHWRYISPNAYSNAYPNAQTQSFATFCRDSEYLSTQLVRGKRFSSSAGELMKRNATNREFPLQSLVEAELLIMLMAAVSQNVRCWPQVVHYRDPSQAIPLFDRAVHKSGFDRIRTITGVDNASKLRELAETGLKGATGSASLPFLHTNLLDLLHVDEWSDK